MGEVSMNVPRLRKIAGRYFWRPTKAVKALGFCAEALGPDPVAAIARARILNQAVTDATLPVERRGMAEGSVSALCQAYQQDEAFKALKASTQDDYRSIMRGIEAGAGSLMVATITKKGLKATYKALKPRGLHIASSYMRMWRVLMGFAVEEGLIAANPAERLRIQTPPSRSIKWTPAQVAAFLAAAEALGRPSVGLGALLAYELGQRQGDVLRLSWTAYDGDCFDIVQSKTGERVRVPASGVLKQALKAAVRGSSTQVVVCEKTGLPYGDDYFRREFARIREAAGLPVELQYRDFRRSALTEAADGGSTAVELKAMSGHRTLGILTTYVRPTDAQARNAIEKRERFRAKVAKAKT